MSKPRIVLYDLETSHNIAAVFQLFDKHNGGIPFDNILKERYIICAAAKLLGEKKVHTITARNGSDEVVCCALHKTLSSADVIVAHNGDHYDIKFARTRMLAHGLPPLPPILSIDTLQVARRHFLFNSNRLDYLGHFLGVGRKQDTPKGLWLDVLRGSRKAVKQMVEYNKQDVLLLERVFEKLRPYITTRLHEDRGGCPRCGGQRIQRRGFHTSVTATYARYQCQACGGWFREVKADKRQRNSTRAL